MRLGEKKTRDIIKSAAWERAEAVNTELCSCGGENGSVFSLVHSPIAAAANQMRTRACS